MASPPVGVKVNLARCTGAEDCVRICPEVFVNMPVTIPPMAWVVTEPAKMVI